MSLVLADTSVWIGHFRRADSRLRALLEGDLVVCHPLVILELACGTPPASRARTFADLRRLRQSAVATPAEILELIEREQLHDRGCGAIDVSLLASAMLTRGTQLWMLDQDLNALALRSGVAYMP